MKAVLIAGKGLDSLRIESVPEPHAPGAGEVLVQCRAFSLNYRDLMVAEGRYGRALDRSQVAGSDMSGEVLAVGPGVTGLKPRDKVLNAPITAWQGGTMRAPFLKTFLGGGGVEGVFAERVILPACALVRFETLSFSQAATLPIAGLTAWSAIVTHGRLEPGGSVLCLGTGGVSIFAAQIAHAMGARVFITSSSDEKLERCRKLIHDHVSTINYKTKPEWHEEVRLDTDGDGVDIVVETVGGGSLEKSIESVTYGGRVCLIGVLDGTAASVNVAKILSRQVVITGIYMESVQELRKLVRFLENHHVRPVIDRHFEFEEIGRAYAHLKSQKHFGKIVVEMD